jgi:hypothetical protein
MGAVLVNAKLAGADLSGAEGVSDRRQRELERRGAASVVA